MLNEETNSFFFVIFWYTGDIVVFIMAFRECLLVVSFKVLSPDLYMKVLFKVMLFDKLVWLNFEAENGLDVWSRVPFLLKALPTLIGELNERFLLNVFVKSL